MPTLEVFHCNGWGNTVPTTLNVDGGGTSYTVAWRFSCSGPGLATGVRWYKSPLDTTGHTCSLWSATGGVLLATVVTDLSQSNSGWQSSSFVTPYPITASTYYKVSNWAKRYYSYTLNQFNPNAYTSIPNIFSGQTLVFSSPAFDGGRYGTGATQSDPTILSYEWYGVDIIVDVSGSTDLSGSSASVGNPVSIGWQRGINLGGPTSINGDCPMGKHLQWGVTQSMSEGIPTPPSIMLTYPGMWRFKWPVQTGLRSISIKAKQVSDVSSSYRPSLVVKANKDVGLNADISSSAASGSSWMTIGPVTFTPTSKGVVWVELWNNDTISNRSADSPTYFDHIVSS